jgi:DNA-binding response OmpR family regulator
MRRLEVQVEDVPAASDALRCGPLWVSPTEMCEVRIRGRRTPMPIRHIRILALLLEAGGRVLSREEIYSATRGSLLPSGSRTIDVSLTRIRKALAPFGRFILTVPERGYRIDVAGLARAR